MRNLTDKQVLIITYYWPPAGGPGVQRWLKFAKYLPEYGIQPVIYTPQNPSYPLIDESLNNEVSPNLSIIRTKIWEPYQWANCFNSKSKMYQAGHFEPNKQQNWRTKLSVFIRGNCFIPDARKFWIAPSVRFLENYLKENQIDTLITTGPPHSMHLIGLQLKQKNKQLKWLADFRDPWTQISYHQSLRLTQYAQKKHLDWERKVIQTADAVIATSFTDAANYQALGAKKVETITNGFESTDFHFKKTKNQHFTMTYSGGLEMARNPLVVWQALKSLINENLDFAEDFQLHFYGRLSEEVQLSLKENELSHCVHNFGYVSHSASIEGICKADVLLLCNFPHVQSKGIIPGKLFEYLATENPILAIGPSGGDVGRVLEETHAGGYFTDLQFNEVKAYIWSVYQNWKNNRRTKTSSAYQQYDRKVLTEHLSKLI